MYSRSELPPANGQELVWSNHRDWTQSQGEILITLIFFFFCLQVNLLFECQKLWQVGPLLNSQAACGLLHLSYKKENSTTILQKRNAIWMIMRIKCFHNMHVIFKLFFLTLCSFCMKTQMQSLWYKETWSAINSCLVFLFFVFCLAPKHVKMTTIDQQGLNMTSYCEWFICDKDVSYQELNVFFTKITLWFTHLQHWKMEGKKYIVWVQLTDSTPHRQSICFIEIDSLHSFYYMIILVHAVTQGLTDCLSNMFWESFYQYLHLAGGLFLH